MRAVRLGASVMLAALALTSAGCNGAGSESPPQGRSSSKDATKPPTNAVPIALDAKCPVMGNLEGAFKDSSQMDDYLACIVPRVEEWIESVYKDAAAHPAGYFFVPAGKTGADGKCEYDDKTLFYCVQSRSIYFGEQAVWTQYTRHGDAAAALIMAHEVTHHFQHLVNVPPARVANEQIRYENQADCGAGAFIAFANGKGWLDPADDIIDLAGALAAAGSVPGGANRTHGSAPERLAAFGRALITREKPRLRFCNRFVPEVALVK